MFDSIDLVFWASFSAAAVVALFESTRRIGNGDTGIQAIAVMAAFACIPVAVAGACFYVYGIQSDRIAHADNSAAKVVDLADSWGNDLSAEVRAKNSLSFASAAFLGTGKLVHHFDSEGNRYLFVPTQAQVNARARVVEESAKHHEDTKLLFFLGVWWSIAGAIGVLLGFLIGRHNKAARANPSINTDAAR